MDRLTKRDKPQLKNFIEDGVCINEKTAVKKLRKFENFMEEQGINSLEDLKNIIECYVTAQRLYLGLSARQNGKYLMLMGELQELVNYKNRWQKLKEWIKKQKPLRGKSVVFFPETILDKMQKLEQCEVKNVKD